MTGSRVVLGCALLVLVTASPRLACGQRPAAPEEIQSFRFRISDVYLDLFAEAERERQEAGVPPTGLTRQRVILQPAVGLGFDGSIYHANLLSYNLLTELGLDWQHSSENPGDSESESHFLQRYHGTIDLLRQQPYATTLFADKDLTYRDYDFFNRVRVDSERYGGRSGYSAGPVPFVISAYHYEETTDDLSRPTSLRENILTFNAQNQREAAAGHTELSYNLNDYRRQDNGYSTQTGLSQLLSAVDTEHFGGDLAQLTSLLNYSSITETPVPTSKLLAQENLQLQHTRRLSSIYDYAFDSSSAGDSDSTTHQGRVGLTHQLYNNLTSGVDVHGYLTHSTSPDSWLDTARFGFSLTEQYTRPLGEWGNVTAGYSGVIDHEDRDANGQTLAVIDEVHVLNEGYITYLNQPNVDLSTLQVTDPTRTIVYVRGQDYSVLPRGLMTEIQRIPGGQISNGGTILASYSALLDPSAKFWCYQNGVNFRIDFWKGLLGLYFRWTYVEFDGAEQLNLRTLDDKIFGIDSSRRWFRVGAEYEIQDSNIAPFERGRLYQSVTYRPAEGTVFSLDADQMWSKFYDNNMTETSYGFMLRSQIALAANLTWTVEGGMRLDRGDTFDRDVGTARTSLNWLLGKLNLNFGYEYLHESHPTDLRERHYAFLRARRSF